MSAVVIFIPGHDLKLEQRRTLLHCDQSHHDVAGIAIGERAWASAVAMVQAGEADLVVTVARPGHTTGPVPVEVAGAGRTTIRNPARAQRVRRIAEFIDTGLSDEQVLRILRSEVTR